MDRSYSGELTEQQIKTVVSDYWWVILLRGLAAIVFGVLAVAWPDATLFVLVIAFGVYTIFDGLIEMWSGFSSRQRNDRWWVDMLIGVVGVVAGVLIMSLPGVTAVVAIYFIAAWMLIVGILQIIYAIRVRQEISNEWFLVLSGVLSVGVAAFFFAFPGDGLVSLVWVIGLYAMLFGILLVVLSFKAKNGFD